MFLLRLSVLITVSCVGNTVSSLITVPKNTVAKLGDRVELECSTNAQIPVRWEFSIADSHNKSIVYHSGIITHSLQDKYAIDNNRKGQYNLIVNSVDLSFGGTYTCIDAEDLSSRSAELIAIVANPVCSTNASTVIVEGYYIQIVCTINYTGNWLLAMDCSKSSGQSIEANINYTRNSMYVPWTSSLITQLSLNDNGVTFMCTTTFKPKPTNKGTADEVVQANNVPDYHHTWNFTACVSNGGVEGLTTFKLAGIIGTNAGALMLCLAIAVIIYKICRKGNSKPDIVLEVKQSNNDSTDRPQAELVPPPIYAEVQRHLNGFRIAEIQSLPVYTSVKNQRIVGDIDRDTVTNNYLQQNQNVPVYAEVNKMKKEKKIPEPSNQIPLPIDTKPKQYYTGADGTQYVEMHSFTDQKANGVPVKHPAMYSLVETYASIDHTIAAPPPPPPLPRRH